MTLFDEMKFHMYNLHGVGLAAPQLGVNKQIIVVDYDQLEGTKNPMFFVNPIYKVSGTELQPSEEGCLSVPGPPKAIMRHNKIEVKARIIDFSTESPILRKFKQEFEGYKATIFQHEIDHLEGKLFFDHLGQISKDMYLKRMKKEIKRKVEWRHQVSTSL